MKILIITPYYMPDLGPSSPLFTMLSTQLVKLGHEVAVIAAVPHYPSGYVQEGFNGRFLQRGVEDGVQITRVRLPSIDRSKLINRSLQFLSFQIGAAIASVGEKFDIVFLTNPAIGIWLPFVFTSSLRNKPTIFSIHDLYPEVGVQLGIFRNKLAVSAVTGLEKFCLEKADYVRILTESFRPSMRNLDVPDEKMVLIYDWVDTELIKPISKDNQFAHENGLDNKFVVLYAGNIGLSQGLEHVLTSAEQLSEHEDIQFVLVGNGAAHKDLVAMAQNRQISNVKFIPFQPRERLPEVLASADVSLVSLRKGVGISALPSKIFSIFASGRPVIASVDEGCETWELVKKSKSGLCIIPEQPGEFTKAILQLKQDPSLCKEMGQNGRSRAEDYHSPKSAAKRIEELALEMLGTG